MPLRCARCGTELANGHCGPCWKCGSTDIIHYEEERYLKAWDQYPLNPYAVTLSSSSATLSSSFVINKYPDTWSTFKAWSKEEKTSELTGVKAERVVLLYSGETERIMEEVATYVAQTQKREVVTAPYIYEKGTGKRNAFQPRPDESLNGFIKRIISEAENAIILYTEQGGQIIETGFCSDMQKPTLGLVHFYRGRGNAKEGEELCPFFKDHGAISRCHCDLGSRYKGKVAGHICSDSHVFCPFTQQRISKMVYDFYITSPNMYLFGADSVDKLKGPIKYFLSGKPKK